MHEDLRRQIARMVHTAKDGHIPSAYSIVDLVAILYREQLRVDPTQPESPERDYFILSKGHGCVAYYTVLEREGFITREDLATFCTKHGILGEHPDSTKIPGVEASTGSLGHGFPFAVGIALALRISGKTGPRVWTLVGDGECHEGTVWEAAQVARNLELGNLCVLVDWNGSAATLMPVDDLPGKWRAFGWNVIEIDGHNGDEIRDAYASIEFEATGVPTAIVARTVKGKGVPMLEGHGVWHHRVPTEEELETIMAALA